MSGERTRDVPHPGRPRVDFNGSRSRGPGTDRSIPRARKELGRACDGDRPPRPPAICGLYPDLVDATEPEAVFGQYPTALIAKILPWLRCRRHEVLHVCSGALRRGEGIRVDIRREAAPDIVADARRLPLPEASVAAVMLDPPYTEQYARDLYGVEYPRPAHLLAEAARVVRPGGRIAFVHYIVPRPPPGAVFVKALGLSMGFGFPMRAVSIYQREAVLPLAEASR